MIQPALYSSAKDNWETPDDLFAWYDRMHHFTLDVAAAHSNAKCARYFTRETNGLAQSWEGERVWCNPPYGREIGKWLAKANEEWIRAELIVMLVPARTDTAWWHDYAQMADVLFLRGRVRFKGAKHSAPFPSAILTWRAP